MTLRQTHVFFFARALPASILLTTACGTADVDLEPAPDGAPAAEVSAGLSSSTTVINREIPIRFVQFVDGTDDSLGRAALNEQIAGANAAFVKAGIRFSLAASVVVTSPTFTTIGGSYAWPSPPSSAPPVAFNPGCAAPGLSGTESEEMALFRAASLCGNESEIVVFTVRSSSQAWGAYPWEGNGIIIQRYNMGAGNRTFAHELGHYLGLSHSFRGAGLGYDLSNPNLKNPATGAPAKLADFWDLVYKPADLPPATTTNVYFSSRAQAAGYPESSLRPIQGNSAWAQNPLGFACYGSLDNCPPAVPDRALRLAVPRTGFEYADCNQADPGYSQTCLCVSFPSACDILYTGDDGLKGLGLTLPGHTPSAPNLGANVMSYNYDPGYTGDRWSLSDSQVEQVKRVLTYDVDSSWFAGARGKRPALGIGKGWGDWEHVGAGARGLPAAATKPSGQLDLVVRNADATFGNKVQTPGSPPSWWPSQLGLAGLGGSSSRAPALVRRGDHLSAFMLGNDNSVYHKVWDPLLAGWWPSQTTWDSLGGPASAPPVAVSPDPGSLDVFTLGASGKVLHKSWSTSTGQWSPSPSGWNDLGAMGSAPTAASWGAGHIDVIALDAGKRAYNKVYNASAGWWPSQTGWQGLGGKQFAETPAVDSWGAGHLDIIGRGADGRAYNKAWEASGWSPSQTDWYDMGGNLAGPPSVVSSDVGHLEVVARSTDGRLLYKEWSAGSWWPGQTDWATLAVDVGGDPILVSSAPGRLDVFVVGPDGTLWHRSRDL